MATGPPTLPEPCGEILSHYDLGAVRTAVPLAGGMFMVPVLVSTGAGRFVVRGTRFRPTLAQFEFQAETMNAAAGMGVLCPRVLPDRHERLGHQVGGAVWAVYEYLDGRTIDWPDWCRTMAGPDDFAEKLGGRVARLHDVLAGLAPGGDPGLSPALPPIQFAHLDAARQDWDRRMSELIGASSIRATRALAAFLDLAYRIRGHWEWLAQQACELAIADLTGQIVHGDVSPVNLVLGETSETCGFIDWDCVHVGTRLYDALGDVVIRPPRNDPAYHALRPQAVRRYLSGYTRATSRPVSEHERACVGAFCLARQLEDLRQRLDVLPGLALDQDGPYAALIAIRVRLMDDITRERWWE